MGPEATIVSVSVDLDAVECYHRIHALPEPPSDAARPIILRRCLPRFAELFARHGVRATFFVVGRDLDDDAEGRALLAELATAGHELASHSYSHPYDLVVRPHDEMVQEIQRSHDVVGACAGRAPLGFRAPGYAVSSAVLDELVARGYRYDSSAFPSVPYYVAKALVMAALRLRGRRSASHLDRPGVLVAPREPYQPAGGQRGPYRRGDMPIVEIPMAVTRWLRLPVIGTSLVTFPNWLRRRMVRSVLQRPTVNFELHGIDLCDARADGVGQALIDRQPDLRVPLSRKLAALDATLAEAREAGARFARLDEVAAGASGATIAG